MRQSDTQKAADLTISSGFDLLVQGSAVPQSQTQRGILDRIGHILDGGHVDNPYPSSPDADDAEFNNSTQGDNNTIGTHAGGDFWEWISGDPTAGSGLVDINTTRLSHLRVLIHKDDPDGVLGADIAAIPGATNVTITICIRWLFPSSTTSDEYLGLRLTDASEANYYEVEYRNDAATPAMAVVGQFVDGGARTPDGTAVTLPRANMPAIWLRWQQTAGDAYATRFSLDGFGFERIASANYTFSNTYVPDTCEIYFGNNDAAAPAFLAYYIDSFRRS